MESTNQSQTKTKTNKSKSSGAILIGTIIYAVLTLTGNLLFQINPANAACGSNFYIEDYSYSGCSGQPVSGKSKAGIAIDTETKTITLENYDGGAITYLCRASCEDTVNYKVKLVGENKISSTQPTAEVFTLEQNLADLGSDYAFLNIIPEFIGAGTLEVMAPRLVAFESASLSGGLSYMIVGNDYMVSAETAENSKLQSLGVTREIDSSTCDCSGNKTFWEILFSNIYLSIALILLLVTIICALIVLIKKMSKKECKETAISVSSTAPDNTIRTAK